MAEFNIRTDAVDVEQIMRQIRTRIESKRGVDYTEQQIHELATAKLERFLDPKGVRSDLLERYRQHRVASATHPPSYAFEDTTTLFGTGGFLEGNTRNGFLGDTEEGEVSLMAQMQLVF